MSVSCQDRTHASQQKVDGDLIMMRDYEPQSDAATWGMLASATGMAAALSCGCVFVGTIVSALLSRLSRRGMWNPSAEYSEILFRSVRTETPSRRPDTVLFPWVPARVSKIKSRSTTLIGKPTSHRARRRREELEI